MNKLPRSAGAAALAAAAVAVGALASACGSGVATPNHQTTHNVKSVVTNLHPGTPKQTQKTGNGSSSGNAGGSRQGTTTGTTPPPPPPPPPAPPAPPAPPVPQTITVQSPTAAAPVLATPTGSQLSASAIPWSQVGPGWTVAVWSPTPIVAGHAEGKGVSEIVLVDPSGQGYVEDTFAAGVWPTIRDWSGNKQNVLVTVYSGNNPTLMDIDLVDGATLSRFDVPNLQSVSFTHPNGFGLLVRQSQGKDASVLARTNLEGRVQMTFAGQSGPGLYTSDGTQLVTAGKGGLEVVTNSGTDVASLPVAGMTSCSPISWWASGQVVASCVGTTSANDYVISLSGAAPELLGPAIQWAPYDMVEHVGGSVFANMPACGTIELMKLVNGQWQNENIPGAVPGSSQIIVGAYGNLLEVNATPSCGENQLQQPSLFWYNPVTNTSNLFFGSTHGGGVVYDAFGFVSYPATQDLPVATA